MSIQFKDGQILFVGGAIAFHADCCCPTLPENTCQPCGFCCWDVDYGPPVVSPVSLLVSYTLYSTATPACACQEEWVQTDIVVPFLTASAGNDCVVQWTTCFDGAHCADYKYEGVIVEYKGLVGGSHYNKWHVRVGRGSNSICTGNTNLLDSDYLDGNCTGGTWSGAANIEANCGGTFDLTIQVVDNACCRCAADVGCVPTSTGANAIGVPWCDISEADNCPP